MNPRSPSAGKCLAAAAIAGLACLGLTGMRVSAQNAPPPFEEGAYLWTQATDTDNFGYGDWGMYKSWLGVNKLGIEVDPDGFSSWSGMCEGYDNQNWGNQQVRYGTDVLPDIILSIGTMPSLPAAGEEPSEDQAWKDEAANNPNVMYHFVNLADNIAAWNCKSVIIRIDYEFDGYWDPWGNLPSMSSMPGNFIQAWQNIVTTIRTEVKKKNPNISVRFLWNPTDSNVQITSANYYPGDAYVDYIGFDSYDYDYTGIYQSGVQPSAATQQSAWTNSISKRVQWFADFASAANPYNRNGYVAGNSVPLIAGEWGLWQVASGGRPAGGDDPVYIQNMYDWMSSNNVYMESYFETPSDGVSTLWPGGYPTPGSGNPHWGTAGTPYPNASATYRSLFGGSAGAASGPPIGHRIGIKSGITNYFTSSDQGDSTYLKALWSTSPGAWEVFDVADAGNGAVALKCEQTGKYVTVDLNQPSCVLRADSASTIGAWETYQWANQGGGVFGLQAYNGLFVTCNLNDGDRLEAQWAQTVQGWEQFTYADLGTDGALAATDPPVTGTVNLAAAGTTDWAHWGYAGVGHLDHKAVKGVAVGTIKATLPSGAAAFATTGAAYTWTGGTPTSAATATATGVSTTTGTFTLTVPLSTSQQTLNVYVGGSKSLGVLSAAASDHSIRPYLNQVGNLSGIFNEVYTLTVAAGQPGQTLSVTWHRSSGTGTVALEAAALH